MRLTSASSYALQAVVIMAREKNKQPMASHLMAEARGIPERFLLKVLKPLVSAGHLRSMKGPHGGYVLARPSNEITVLDIVEAVDGPIRGHVGFQPGRTGAALTRKLDDICRAVADQQRRMLKKVTIADLAKG
jgi:Rrf2 family protein